MKNDFLFVFSENVRIFLNKMRIEVFQILNRECGLSVEKKWFIFGGRYHYLNVVLFEHPRMLGSYNPARIEIGLHKKLMLAQSEDLVRDILRHETAHLMTHLHYGETFMDHGSYYRSVCSMYKWGENVQSATIDIEQKDNATSEGSHYEAVIRRVKKLLALSSSDNPHEARIATLKANQILLTHNIRLLENAGVDEGEQIYMKRVLEVRRNSAKLMSIGKILESFLVSPVFSHRDGSVYLEVTGDRANVEIAEHVASFLERSLESMWIEARSKGLGGIRDKNSFMMGVAEGYLAKIKKTKSECTPTESLAMIALESRLKQRLALVYPRLNSTRTRGFFSRRSFGEGKEAGKRLSIKKGIRDSSAESLRLTYRHYY